ncbi:MAG: hypothetical protein LBH72_08035 [Proteiniphilum sp.]|jgi:hypothetical protein|nr:hypothetical protein [Proteiniphilum sp.]
MQTTSKILMVRPFRFAFNEETALNNHFQQQADFAGAEAVRAQEEFDAFVNRLRGRDVEVLVVQDSPDPLTPDAVFPNNWFSSHLSGELVLYPVFAPNRRLERKREAVISTYGTILSVPLSTVEMLGGGSVRCMMAEIFY